MTLTFAQKEKVSALRSRFARNREAVLSSLEFAASVEAKARQDRKAAYDEWLSLDSLVNASDLHLLAIAEATAR